MCQYNKRISHLLICESSALLTITFHQVMGPARFHCATRKVVLTWRIVQCVLKGYVR